MRKVIGPLAISSALGLTASLSLGATPASLTIGTSIAGGAYGANGAAGSANYVKVQGFPPDMAGAVGGTGGNNFAVQIINGYVGMWSLTNTGTTTNASLVTQETDSQFWTNAGVSIGSYNTPFDPRLIYDSNTQRWFATEDSFSQSGYANNIMLAVSKTSDPTQGWTAFALPGSLPNAGGSYTGPGTWQGTTYGGGTGTWTGTVSTNGAWQGTVGASPAVASPSRAGAKAGAKASSGSGYFADFPTLGVSPGYVTIGANLYPAGSGNDVATGGAGITIISIPKASLLTTTATTTGITSSYNLNPTTYGFTPNAVNDMSTGTTTPSTAYVLGNGGYSGVQQTTITTNAATPVVSASTYTTFNETGQTVQQLPQPGTTHTLDGGDSRLSSSLSLVNINGTPLIWGVQTIGIAGPNNTTVNGLRVFAVAAGNNKPVVDQIFTDTANPSESLAYGSLAINTSGQLVLTFNESGGANGQFVQIRAVAGTFNSSTNSIIFGTPQTLKASSTDYYLLDTQDNLNRWGDYSVTAADPNNAGVFYSFAEYATGAATWGTQITQLTFVPATAGIAAPSLAVSSVPEPAAIGLIILGGLPLLMRRRAAR